MDRRSWLLVQTRAKRAGSSATDTASSGADGRRQRPRVRPFVYARRSSVDRSMDRDSTCGRSLRGALHDLHNGLNDSCGKQSAVRRSSRAIGGGTSVAHLPR